MKITFISPAPNLSGGQRVIAIYADRLLERGHDVTVVARGRAMPSKRARVRHFLKGKPIRRPRVSHFDDMKARLVVLPHASPVTAADVPDADVVIATWWETAFEVVHFPATKGRKFYFVQHHEVHTHLPQHLSGASYLLPLKKITISSWLVDTMDRLYGDRNVALVKNSVDHSMFWATERGRQAQPTIGLLYSTMPFKGVDISSRAIEIARRQYPDLRVIAFGAVAPTKDLPLPKGADFHLRPSQDRIRELYKSCDVFLSASRSEGFGLPILEAMSCRTPVIATRTGCAEDVIEEGVNGYTADVDDTAALAAHLVQILSLDDHCWREMSDAAYNKTLNYTWCDAAALMEAELSDAP